MPRTKEQNIAIREERKQSIMDAALQLFADNGFENTSIDSIANHAGISKGLLYSYFKCKDDLLYQILTSGMQKFSESFHSEMTMEDFVAGIENAFEYITENRDFYKLYTIISVQPKVTKNIGVLTNEYDSLYHNMVDLFKRHFGEQRAARELSLLSVIMKGFSIVSVFSDEQNVIPVDSLKNTIMDLIKERYKF